MKRPVTSRLHVRANRAFPPRGYTMIEILMATALMLIIMLAVAWVFGMVGESISDSRSTLEMSSALRTSAARLSRDLKGITVTRMGNAWKPRDPGANEGYFEYTEGPMGPVVLPGNVAMNIDVPSIFDSTVGDIDDILMFTTRDIDEPFIGQVAMKRDPNVGETPDGTDAVGDYVYDYDTIQAEAAEVAWFVRGTTLYRRQLLVFPKFPEFPEVYDPAGNLVQKFNMDWRLAPPGPPGSKWLLANLNPAGFYNNDVSIRLEVPLGSPVPIMMANTLGDLTKPENRFAHRTIPLIAGYPIFPFHPHFYVDQSNPPASRLQNTQWATQLALPSPLPDAFPSLGLPTLRECSHPDWIAGAILPIPGGGLNPRGSFDAWVNPHAWQELDLATGTISLDPNVPATAPSVTSHPPLYMGPRVGEDVILTNVISFDVKARDPGAPILPAINARGTPTDQTDDAILDADNNNIADVAVTPGDAGYALALWHFQNAVISPPPTPLSYGAYVDLNYTAVVGNLPALSDFAGPGQPWFPLGAALTSHTPRVYDTWSTHYDNNWVDANLDGLPSNLATNPGQPPDRGNENFNLNPNDPNVPWRPLIDEGANGMDDNLPGIDDDDDGTTDERGEGNGAVDDLLEQEAPAPYPVPLRGIQITIRVFEPDSRQIREMTIVQDFVTE